MKSVSPPKNQETTDDYNLLKKKSLSKRKNKRTTI
jgi:hypothetical protein